MTGRGRRYGWLATSVRSPKLACGSRTGSHTGKSSNMRRSSSVDIRNAESVDVGVRSPNKSFELSSESLFSYILSVMAETDGRHSYCLGC